MPSQVWTEAAKNPRADLTQRACPVRALGGAMRRQRGETLIEVVISILVLGIVAVAILASFRWSLVQFGYVDRKATAESVARSQWEYVKTQQYRDDLAYDRLVVPGYSIEMTAGQNVESGKQKITYTVTSPPQADGQAVTVALEGYKVDR